QLNGDLARGRQAIDWALALDPDEPALRHNRSVILEALGEVHGAVAESAWAVAYGPRVPMYRYQYGHALLSARRVADAVLWLRSAVHMRSNFALARRDLGWALLLAGEDDASLRELEGAMSAPEAERYYALALAVARGMPEARAWVARRD